MQQSNAYIIIFTAILTFVVGGLLSFSSQILAPAQKKSIELDTKTSILSSVMDREELKKMKPDEVLAMYNDRINSIVVDINGEEVTTDAKGAEIVAEEVDIAKNYKLAPEDRLFPVFTYSDNGKGIKSEDLSQIFDPFFTTKRGQGGRGLGLHLVYNLVTQKLQGTIECQSQLGHGTKFILKFPMQI